MAQDGFALIAYRDEGVWGCERLPSALLDDLNAGVAALEQQPTTTCACVLVNVDDEFFVAIRHGAGGDVRLLLSDVTAAVDYELARQALEFLGEDLPSAEEMDDVWPAGDLAIFADLGLSEMELRAILDDLDLYADEMIEAIAGRVGFADPYAAVVEARQ